MRKIIFLGLFALCFATGFTCSKNTPLQEAQSPTSLPETPQEQMAAPPAAEGQATGTPEVSPTPLASPGL